MKGKKIELAMTMESRSESSDGFLVVFWSESYSSVKSFAY